MATKKTGKEQTDKSADDSKHATLHPHTVDHAAEEAFREKFEGDLFYGTQRAIRNMIRADRETRKFDTLTRGRRSMPEVNHERNDQPQI